MDREKYVLIGVIIFLVSLFVFSIYKTSINPDVKEIKFKVFDYVKYSESNIKIHTFNKGSFTIWGDIDVVIVEDAIYHLKYFKNHMGYYIPIEIRRVII